MKYEVDMSGKIEQSNFDSVVCIANKEFNFTVRIKKKVKNKLFLEHVQKGKPIQYKYKLLGYLIAVCVIQTKNATDVVVDTEYPGRMSDVFGYTKQFLSCAKRFDKVRLHAGFVGKKSYSHIWGNKVFSGKSPVSLEIKKDQAFRVGNLPRLSSKLKD